MLNLEYYVNVYLYADYLKKSNSTDTIFIIACTELSIAFANFDKDENWIDTLDLQAEKAIELLLQQQ